MSALISTLWSSIHFVIYSPHLISSHAIPATYIMSQYGRQPLHTHAKQSIGNDSFIGGGHRMSCGSNSSIIGINSVMGLGPNSAVGTHSLLSPCSPGLLTPNDRQQHQQHQHGHFTRARRSPCKREDDSGGAAAVSPLSRTGGAGGGALVARRSLSCSPSCRFVGIEICGIKTCTHAL